MTVELRAHTEGGFSVYDNYSVKCKSCDYISKNIVFPGICHNAKKWHMEKFPDHTEFEVRGYYIVSDILTFDDISRIVQHEDEEDKKNHDRN